jgi:enamine deaminase RidA (YjgF/YER057c/UK114 family)
MAIADRLEELGIVLPTPPQAVGSYRPAVRHGDLLYVSGHGPVGGSAAGGAVVQGKVGTDLDLVGGRRAARLTGLAILATLQDELGDLDRVVQIVKLLGMVNVAPGFDEMPAVIDGCSDLLIDVFGDRGRHARSAVGMAELPFGIAVEIELIVAVS